MFFIAAKVLSEQVSEDDLRIGRVFPPFDVIRDVSARIAEAVAVEAFETDLAERDQPDDLYDEIRRYMFDPSY